MISSYIRKDLLKGHKQCQVKYRRGQNMTINGTTDWSKIIWLWICNTSNPPHHWHSHQLNNLCKHSFFVGIFIHTAYFCLKCIISESYLLSVSNMLLIILSLFFFINFLSSLMKNIKSFISFTLHRTI